jgi:hypothetical protein
MKDNTSCEENITVRKEGIKKPKSSGYRGVYWKSKCNGWVAQYKKNNKNNYIGFFKTEVEAARAYDEKSSLLGNTVLNFETVDSDVRAVEIRSIAKPPSRRRKRSTGISFNTRLEAWQAYHRDGDKRVYIGKFATEEEAIRAQQERSAKQATIIGGGCFSQSELVN